MGFGKWWMELGAGVGGGARLVVCLMRRRARRSTLFPYATRYRSQEMAAGDAMQKVREERPGSIQSFPQEEIIFQFAKSLQR